MSSSGPTELSILRFSVCCILIMRRWGCDAIDQRRDATEAVAFRLLEICISAAALQRCGRHRLPARSLIRFSLVCNLGLVTVSDSWRSCCRSSVPLFMGFDSGIFWNGAIHWVGDYFSIYFDANSEEVHLHLIQVQSLYAKKFDVLELDKNTWKWSVKYRVHLARLISTFPDMVQQASSGRQYAFSILSVIRGENEKDSVLLLTIPGKVVA
ncbi:hypothetical protein RND71_021879 [Anisodus tanguticus]|uniref:Uncharacterized protein n=1 Tax=Anisodus tanguticus TaxID=243964 RepID=A0AAE1VGJ2_9SOLA|nr:hypothetical protein RND71_021879 [Anisodus tanguticus]